MDHIGEVRMHSEARVRLLEMPMRSRIQALNDAMRGLGNDEYILTELVCTISGNTHKEVQRLYV